MAASSTFKQFSLTAGSNTPLGSHAVGNNLDDELRSIKQAAAQGGRWAQTATASAAATMGDSMLHKVQPATGSAAGSVTMTLPAVGGNVTNGWMTSIRNADGGTYPVIVVPTAGTIDGESALTLSATNQAVTLVTDATNWFKVAEHKSSAVGGWQPLTPLTAFGTETEIEIDPIEDGFDYRIEWYDLAPSADDVLQWQAYIGGAYGGSYSRARVASVDSAFEGENSASTSFFGVGFRVDSAPASGQDRCSGFLEIYQPANANCRTLYLGKVVGQAVGGSMEYHTFMVKNHAEDAMTKFKMYWQDASTFASNGTYAIYRRPNGR